MSAYLNQLLQLKKSFFDELKPLRNEGILMLNPPYGVRLAERDLINFYKAIGDTMKRNWPGFQAWIITADMKAAKFIGLRPAKKIELFNGPLESRLLCFDLYEGSKKEIPKVEKRKPGKAFGKQKKRPAGKYGAAKKMTAKDGKRISQGDEKTSKKITVSFKRKRLK